MFSIDFAGFHLVQSMENARLAEPSTHVVAMNRRISTQSGLLASFVFSALSVCAGETVPFHFESGGGSPQKIVWQTVPGVRYDLFISGNLDGWTHVEGFPKLADGPEMEQAFAPGVRKFFKIVPIDEPPALEGFSWIPAGPFMMGDPNNEGRAEERPVHSVFVSSFYMQRHEVTKALWDEVRTWGAAHDYTDLPAGDGKAANHPVHSISAYSMMKWCNARSEKDGLSPCYKIAGAVFRTGNGENVVCDWNVGGYRLPTEAEWEKAARGGETGTRFPAGQTINHDIANYCANGSFSTYDTSPYKTPTYHPDWNDGVFPCTSPVGSFAANGYGLFDMSGNLMERCWDLFGIYSSEMQTDPHGSDSGTQRIRRGGAWDSNPYYCRVASRSYVSPTDSDFRTGFRTARSWIP